jgi:hypothetical protein
MADAIQNIFLDRSGESQHWSQHSSQVFLERQEQKTRKEGNTQYPTQKLLSNHTRKTTKTKILWTFYDEIKKSNDGIRQAKCKDPTCSKVLRLNQSSTSSLRSHLFSQHPGSACKLTQMEKEAKQKRDEEIVNLVAEIEEDREYERSRDENLNNRATHLTHAKISNNNHKDVVLPRGLPVVRTTHLFEAKWSIFDKRQLELDLIILKYLIQSDLAFNHVENPGFSDLITKLAPRAVIKAATTFSR